MRWRTGCPVRAEVGSGLHVAIYAPNDYRVSLLHLGINLADFAWLSVHIRNSIETNARECWSTSIRISCSFTAISKAISRY